jgi:hypothetical protein
MKKTICITALLGIAMLPCAVFAQTPAAQPSTAPEADAASTVIPTDQQPTKEQLAKLFEVMKVRDQLASVTKMMPALMQQEMKAHMEQMKKNHPEMAAMNQVQQQVAAQVMNKFMTQIFELYTSDEMVADLVGIYQKHLTSSDVDVMIAFYISPTGQHMVAAQPVIMKEYMPLVMSQMQARLKPLIEEMSKEMEQIAKPATSSAEKPTAEPPAAAVVQDRTEKQEAAKQAAKSWLALVDAAKFGQSWKEAASFFQLKISQADWVKALQKSRTPLGVAGSRTLLGAQFQTDLPNAPEGEYVILQYKTEFAGTGPFVETITPMLDKDGKWRVAGYFFKPAQ